MREKIKNLVLNYSRKYEPEYLFSWEKFLLKKRILPIKKEAVPHFLGIGLPKAGTSWLSHNLRKHSEVYMGIKEIHYFDRYYSLPFFYYQRFFPTDQKKVKGEITPAYSTLSENKIQFIKSIMPDVKIILQIRNPVERSWSNFLMHVKRGNVKLESESDFVNFVKGQKTAKVGHAEHTINKYEKYFDKDHFFICFFDDIKSRPEELLREIFTFLSVSPDIDMESFELNKVVNKGLGFQLADSRRKILKDLHQDEISFLTKRFPEKTKNWN